MKNFTLILNLSLEQDNYQKAIGSNEQENYLKKHKQDDKKLKMHQTQETLQECFSHRNTDPTYPEHTELEEEQYIRTWLYPSKVLVANTSSRQGRFSRAYRQGNCFCDTTGRYFQHRSSQDSREETLTLSHLKGSEALQDDYCKPDIIRQSSCDDSITITLKLQDIF